MLKKAIIGSVVAGLGFLGYKNPDKVKAGANFVKTKVGGFIKSKLVKKEG